MFNLFLQVTRLCDLSGDGDTVTSVSWAERVKYQIMLNTVNVLKFHTPKVLTKWHMQTV